MGARMHRPLVLVTGFGSFEQVEDNPSGAVARRLEEDPPSGIDVRARVLPVSFMRAPEAWDELCSGLGRTPDFLLGLGVQPNAGFRLERRARAGLNPASSTPARPDVDGVCAVDAALPTGPDFECELDLDALAAHLTSDGTEACVSDDAGGYVCERIYHHLLSRARSLAKPGLFLHVPPFACAGLEQQTRVAKRLLERCVSC